MALTVAMLELSARSGRGESDLGTSTHGFCLPGLGQQGFEGKAIPFGSGAWDVLDNFSTPAKIPPPPGLEFMAEQVQSDCWDALNNLSTPVKVAVPSGFWREHEADQINSDESNIVEVVPTVENIPLPRMLSKKIGKMDGVKAYCNEVQDGNDVQHGRRTLLIAYFPREANEHCLQRVFENFGKVDITNLVKDKLGSPLCYAFIRFADASTAKQAFSACQSGQVVIPDKDGKAWYLKASWARNGFGKKGKTWKRRRTQVPANGQ